VEFVLNVSSWPPYYKVVKGSGPKHPCDVNPIGTYLLRTGADAISLSSVSLLVICAVNFFVDEELVMLKEEFRHHKDKLDEYDVLRAEVDRIEGIFSLDF
jgi:Alpha-2-macroglobulin RAP, C-terminal domain